MDNCKCFGKKLCDDMLKIPCTVDEATDVVQVVKELC